jgi:hypothetical protein
MVPLIKFTETLSNFVSTFFAEFGTFLVYKSAVGTLSWLSDFFWIS